MSLIGALETAVGGMNAQSTALATISDNVANSQTVGFKQTDTAFDHYVTDATATSYAPGAVVAKPRYTASDQGTITSVTNPTSLAISGGGLFAVQKPTGSSTFSTEPYYTRLGDFTPNSNGYLINSSGYALEGWPAVPNTGGTQFATSAAAPIQISKSPAPPLPTSTITLAANLPSTPPTGTTSYTSNNQVYDAGGNAQQVTTTWSQVTANGPVDATSNPVSETNPILPDQWDLTVTSGANTTGPLTVTFGMTAANAGMITSIKAPANASAATLAAVPAAQTTGSTAALSLGLNYGLGDQKVALNLGSFGTATGVTQFTGTTYAVTSQTQDGAAQGNYSAVTIRPTGDVVISYDNGSTSTIGRIPLVSFANPDGLQEQNGQAYTATTDSGSATSVVAGTAGTGTIEVGAEEGSNVDIATQFTQMIVAQQAYSANAKMITTTNQMMQTTLQMVQG